MNKDEAFRFLAEHQPMPDFPDHSLMNRFKATTMALYNEKDEACIPLYLNSFGEWEDLTIYDSIQTVLRGFPQKSVVPHLILAMSSKNRNIMYWCADTARYFPDKSLIPCLASLMEDPVIDVRLAGAAALEQVNRGNQSDEIRAMAAQRHCMETDEDILEVLESILADYARPISRHRPRSA